MMSERHDRNEMFFGKDGQERMRQATCAVVGVGGLGTHIVQQLALLGVGGIAVIDSEELAETNRNRYIGVRHDDPVPGCSKVDLAERLVQSIDPSVVVTKVRDSLISDNAFGAVRTADYVFGCLDCEGARLVLTELCAAYAKPYFDLASDIDREASSIAYGGRICAATDGHGCLVCLDVLDMNEAGRDLEGEAERRNREAIYGVPRNALGRSGPSIVSINGVVASLAVTEFVVTITGLRLPKRLVNYYGQSGKVTVSSDRPRPSCWYCSLWGTGQGADVERYIRMGLGQLVR